MSSSFLRRIWNRMRNPTHFIGRDLEGNKYFEYPNANDAFGRTKRVVKYRRGYDMWTYIAGDRRLPVQWTAWLTHTRIHAPSLEELRADLARQERIKTRVAMINAAERAPSHAVPQPEDSNHPGLPNTQQGQSSQAYTVSDQSSQAQLDPTRASKPSNHLDTPFLARDPPNDQPEAWIPHVARQRSGSN